MACKGRGDFRIGLVHHYEKCESGYGGVHPAACGLRVPQYLLS